MEEKLIFENGPSQKEVDEWKAKFGDVYSIALGGEKYLYRPMRRFEYKQVMQISQTPDNKSYIEEKIAQICVIWPKIDASKLSTLKAGTISTLVDLVMVASNFGITEEPTKL